MHQTEMQKYIAKIGESTVFVVKSVGTFRMETSRDEEVIELNKTISTTDNIHNINW